MNEKIINLTPHEITVVDFNGNVVSRFPKCDKPARLTSISTECAPIAGIRTTRTAYNGGNIPKQKQGVYYIVSQMIKNEWPNRTDLLVPTDVVRDNDGRIVGCRALGR